VCMHACKQRKRVHKCTIYESLYRNALKTKYESMYVNALKAIYERLYINSLETIYHTVTRVDRSTGITDIVITCRPTETSHTQVQIFSNIFISSLYLAHAHTHTYLGLYTHACTYINTHKNTHT
jgi:hypothetical protein